MNINEQIQTSTVLCVLANLAGLSTDEYNEKLLSINTGEDWHRVAKELLLRSTVVDSGGDEKLASIIIFLVHDIVSLFSDEKDTDANVARILKIAARVMSI